MSMDIKTVSRDIEDFFVDDNDPKASGFQVKLCADLIVYYDGYVYPLKSNRDGALDFYHNALEILKPELRYVLIDGNGRYKKVTAKTYEMLPYWASDDCPTRLSMSVRLDGGDTPESRSDYSFFFKEGGDGCLRMIVPVEFMLDNPKGFVELAVQMCRRLRFETGQAGFSLHMHEDYHSPGSHIRAVSQRFLGIDIGTPMYWSGKLIKGVKTVSWLTLVGDRLLEKLGGRDGLRERLLTDIPVHDLDHGVIIQAGPKPTLGDVNAGYDISYYRRVSRVLEPIRVPPETLGRHNDIGGTNNTRRWMARFDNNPKLWMDRFIPINAKYGDDENDD